MKTELEVKQFVKEKLSEIIGMAPEEIKEDVPINTHYGLDSMKYLTLGAQLEDLLDVELTADFIYEYKTIKSLTENSYKLYKEGL